MCSDTVICASSVSKCYQIYDNPRARLKQFFSRTKLHREFWALKELSFEVKKGEAIGIMGRNGSGKSTLMQIVCGTLTPSSGVVTVSGRIAALLELGAGFNPEFSGRENAYLSAAILGLKKEEMDGRFEEIVAFSGIREFIDQPVKTYSSGMYVRLAFSVATCVDPDILVIDEALSVGDGEFSRKSFDRIMGLKSAGKTILFCSHSLYQIEAICDRAIWLDHGKLMLEGPASEVVRAYNASLFKSDEKMIPDVEAHDTAPVPQLQGQAILTGIKTTVDGMVGKQLVAESKKSTIEIAVSFASDPSLPCPSIAAGFMLPDGRVLCSAWSHFDHIKLERKPDGSGIIILTFPEIPLLKGNYWVAAYLFCENGIHVYDCTNQAAEITVKQAGLEQGIVSLPHFWVTKKQD